MNVARPPRLIAVVNCGMGNIHSLLGCLHRLASSDNIELTADPAQIAAADCVFLPGDGAFGAYVQEIDRRGLRATLVHAATTKPFFGICVGMQVLYEGCDEGEGAGLGVLPGHVTRFPQSTCAKIPLMGWLDVCSVAQQHPLLRDVQIGTRYYFLHSYHASANGEHVVMTGEHTQKFAAAVARDNLFATQFHPEKSAQAGVSLLEGFLA